MILSNIETAKFKLNKPLSSAIRESAEGASLLRITSLAHDTSRDFCSLRAKMTRRLDANGHTLRKSEVLQQPTNMI